MWEVWKTHFNVISPHFFNFYFPLSLVKMACRKLKEFYTNFSTFILCGNPIFFRGLIHNFSTLTLSKSFNLFTKGVDVRFVIFHRANIGFHSGDRRHNRGMVTGENFTDVVERKRRFISY